MVPVYIFLEQRFERTADGAVWSRVGFPYSFWDRYLNAFEKVVVVARMSDVPHPPTPGIRSDGSRVEFISLPPYVGPWQYLRQRNRVRQSIREILGRPGAFLFRVPSLAAGIAQPYLRRHRRPFALEVVGDPYDVYAPGAVSGPLRPYFRWRLTRDLRMQCSRAVGVGYVSQQLRQRYPASADATDVVYSSIQLDDHSFAAAARSLGSRRPLTLLTVASLEQLYKAPDVLLRAVASCIAQGVDLRLRIVGTGRYRAQLEGLSAHLGIEDRVDFVGHLSRPEDVRLEYDRADLFVLPSRTEGLPRAMIEAMARGLPCVGSTAGGIPELLPVADLVTPGDVRELAERIVEVLLDADAYEARSARSLERARQFHESMLRPARETLYGRLAAAAAASIGTGR